MLRDWEGNLAESNGSLLPGGWPAGWLPVHRDQLRAQRAVTSMGSLYLFMFAKFYVHIVTYLFCRFNSSVFMWSGFLFWDLHGQNPRSAWWLVSLLLLHWAAENVINWNIYRDHPRSLLGGLYHCAKFGCNRCSRFNNVDVLIFCMFCF